MRFFWVAGGETQMWASVRLAVLSRSDRIEVDDSGNRLIKALVTVIAIAFASRSNPDTR